MRGSSEDWNRYATATGNNGWRWPNILRYFKKSERWTAPADNHNITGQFEPSVHGFDGLLGVSLAGHPTHINDMAMTASRQLGKEFRFNSDYNSGSPLGLGECVGELYLACKRTY